MISRRITMQVLKERTKYAGEIHTTVKIMSKYVILLKLGSKPRKKNLVMCIGLCNQILIEKLSP